MRIPVLICVLLLPATVSPAAAQMTGLERQRLVAHLEMTAGWLVDEVSGLSQAQLEFRRAADSWSILEVVEHLVIVGPIYWEELRRGVEAPPREATSMSRDSDLLWYGIDRADRGAALAEETPKGQLRNLQSGLTDYRRQHARLLQYVRTTKDDLRKHVVERQGIDAYQWALMISAHEQRHVLQIREIKADSRFPRR